MSVYDPNWEVDKVDKSDIDGFTMTNIYYSTPMVEYNMFMTIFSTFKEIINEVAEDYGLNWNIDVIPEFPKDLTKVKYPSVCIREAGIEKTALYLGKPLKIEDDSIGAILDTINRKHTMNIQFDAVAKTNGERLKLKSLVDEVLARMTSFNLLNFNGAKGKSYMLPTVFGEKIKSDGDLYSENITVDTLQYVGVTRLRFTCVEIIVPRDNNEIVDLYNLCLVHDDYLDEGKDHAVTRHTIFQLRPIYKRLKKVKDYLFEADYELLDTEFATQYFRERSELDNFSCSAVRNGNFYGRNLDWIYSEQAEFVVRVSKTRTRNASIAVCGTTGLNNDNVFLADSELYKILPFKAYDGINEHGVFANINVVPTDFENSLPTTPLKQEKDVICLSQVVRYILDNFSSAKEAVEYIRDYVTVYAPTMLTDMNYEAHFMIGDEENNYIIEFVDNRTNIIEHNIMTNFHITDVTFNENGSVYTPYINTPTENAFTENGITSHGAGLERYNLINERYDTLNDYDNMLNMMDSLKYSNAYSEEFADDEFWYTEFVEDDLTSADEYTEFAEIKESAINAYKNKTRNPDDMGYGLWFTSHSSVYDIENRELTLEVQESGEKHKYAL